MRNLGEAASLTVALCLCLVANTSSAAISGITRVAGGLSLPVFATHAPGDRNRLFIAELGTPLDTVTAQAAIRILDLNSGSVLSTPFLTIPDLDTYGEGGLLGMAFHPDYSNNGKFYVYVTVDPDGTQVTESPPMVSQIREYTVSSNPNIANTSFTTLLSYNQPQNNHNGGWIGFGPNDDYLYIAWGDGGGSNDSGSGHVSGGNAQDTTNNLLGKILRIDVNDPDPNTGPNYAIPPTNPFVAGVGDLGDDVGDDEIWAYGLRNPFRASFDRITADLWIGDVGQNNREEIDYQPAASTGGENYGWRLREGDIATPTGGVGGTCTDCVEPIYSYTHPGTSVPPVSPPGYTGNIVTGGYVYRGPDPSLQGMYFFLDAGGNNHWMVDTDPTFGTVTNIDSLLTPNTGSPSNPVSFGEDAVGNLYIVYLGSGEVYRLATNQLMAGDYDADGLVDSADEARWRQTYGTTGVNLAADGNKNGTIDAADYVVVRKFFGASVHDGAGGGNSVPEPAAAIYALQVAMLIVAAVARRRAAKPTVWRP